MMDRGIKREGFAVIGLLLLCAMAMQTRATTITEVSINDSGPGSLRQGLVNANDGDTINFAVTGNIALTSGGLVIDKNVTISGPGANELSIDGKPRGFCFRRRSGQNRDDLRPDHPERPVWDWECRHANRQ